MGGRYHVRGRDPRRRARHCQRVHVRARGVRPDEHRPFGRDRRAGAPTRAIATRTSRRRPRADGARQPAHVRRTARARRRGRDRGRARDQLGWTTRRELQLEPGQSAMVRGHTVTYISRTVEPSGQKTTIKATVKIDGVGTLHPAISSYPNFADGIGTPDDSLGTATRLVHHVGVVTDAGRGHDRSAGRHARDVVVDRRFDHGARHRARARARAQASTCSPTSHHASSSRPTTTERWSRSRREAHGPLDRAGRCHRARRVHGAARDEQTQRVGDAAPRAGTPRRRPRSISRPSTARRSIASHSPARPTS